MSTDALTILVVEDDPASARLAEVALRQTKAKVIVHQRSFGVLEMVATHRPVVVVMDVMMPGLDGPALVELIRQDTELKNTRVVLWSALDRRELVRLGQACGADGVIEKVAGPRELVDQLSGWLLRWDEIALR